MSLVIVVVYIVSQAVYALTLVSILYSIHITQYITEYENYFEL